MKPPPAAPVLPPASRTDIVLARAAGVALTVGRVLLPVVLLLLVAAGIGYVRLRHGPISMAILVDPISRGISTELDGAPVTIEDAVLSLGEEGGLDFRLANLTILSAERQPILTVPEAAVELSWAALWSARIVPDKVELIEPKINLFYTDADGLRLSVAKASDALPSPAAEALTKATGPESSDGSASDDTKTKVTDVAKDPSQLYRLDLARLIAETTARARRGTDATSYLREAGVRNATITLDHNGRRTVWRVPEVNVDLDHRRKHSVISGAATIASERGPWTLTFRTDDFEKTRNLMLRTSVRDLVPKTLARAGPQFSPLATFDMPVAADFALDFSSDGELRTANLAVEVGQGRLRFPAIPEAPVDVSAGLLTMTYSGAERKLTLQPSKLKWADGQITVAGDMMRPALGAPWSFDIHATEGVLAAEEFGIAAIPLEKWGAKGQFVPERGVIALEGFEMRAGGGGVTLKGETNTGLDMASARLEGEISPMPLSTLKVLWPKTVAPGARRWVGQDVRAGNITGGAVRFISGSYLDGEAPGMSPTGDRLSFALEATDVVTKPVDEMAPVEAPRVLVRLENDALEVTVPEAAIALTPERRVPLKQGRVTAENVSSPRPIGEISFNFASPVAPVLDVLDQLPMAPLKAAGLSSDGMDGKAEGQLKLKVPFVAKLDSREIEVDGNARVSDGRAKALIGGRDVQGAIINVDLKGSDVIATGEALVSGVLAKINWQRKLNQTSDQQPPLQLSARLDNADRTQLGLDINHIVRGEVPVEITVVRSPKGEPQVQISADLTAAEVAIDGAGWKKPAGQNAKFTADVASGKTHKTELQNFKITGDNIAVEGWIGIDAASKVREFYFPDFSLNTVSRLEVQGTLGKDEIWAIKARGPTFDGREFFRSLFSLGESGEASVAAGGERSKSGVDLDVEVGNVIGFFDVGLRGVKMKMSRRGDKMTALDGRGTFDGGQPIAFLLRQDGNGPRMLLADSTDAGQAFKLIGFYPNVQGGRVRLEVNLEGKGAAEKTGTLWVDDFRILGDAVASEVFSSADATEASIGAGGTKKRVTREVFDFDQMVVPFSVGFGQFVMDDSILRGGSLGVTMRGKVDYKAKTVNIGGTYVPMQGLNNAFGGIPLIGQILSGPRGEGIFGITFAVQGAMANPEVIVNPLSLVTPGLFRDIFQMTPSNPKVVARPEKRQAVPAEKRVKAPSVPAAGGGWTATTNPSDNPSGNPKPKPAQKETGTIDGWSSETTVPGAKVSN